jgi:hypothetical protein
VDWVKLARKLSKIFASLWFLALLIFDPEDGDGTFL